MTNRSGTPQNHARENSARNAAARTVPAGNDRRARVVYKAGISAMLFAPIAAGLLLAGCGGQSSEPQKLASQEQSSPPAEQTVAVAAMSGGSTVGAETGGTIGRPESPSPDIVVSVADTLVSPGEVVEFSVQGTSDVTELLLADGINDSQAFVRDSTGVWRVNYRVPLRPKHERFGLSVTARNDANRWRRVWVFLNTKSVEPEQSRLEESREAEPDSGR